jgi:presqualene diphosphate synthase
MQSDPRRHALSPGVSDSSVASLPAASSSFYLAMRILPRARREAMYAIYAFCRAVDDVADRDGLRDARLSELEGWRSDLERLYAGAQAPERLAALAGPIRAFRLRKRDFLAVVDGMAMDAAIDLQAPDQETLDLYCDRVASAVGRLSVRVFGLDAGPGEALAHHLGRALQLTNILRDLDEDAARGRLYLPREALEQAGIRETAPERVLAHPRLAEACAALAGQADHDFREAGHVMAACPRASVRAPRLMAAAYQGLLARLVARGWTAPRGRVSTDKRRLLTALLRYGLF